MQRYLKDWQLTRVSKDFEFLFDKIRKSRGELDFRLRNGYFNLYFKGNSLAKVTVRREDYLVEIHYKFIPPGFFDGDERFKGTAVKRGAYLVYNLTAKDLHPFFQTKYLERIGRNITLVNYGEEITFEHLLITDNLEREDFYILDRQVTETALRRSRMDLLALTQVEGKHYRFLVIEVKLGNNPELEGKIQEQLESYTAHLESHFEAWKRGYEETYRQMKSFGLFDFPSHAGIEIVEGVQSMICVGGYTGVAEIALAKLLSRFPRAQAMLFKQSIDWRKTLSSSL
ncbi:MAG: hypothetical protein P1P76_06420 [Anaerolineales bacterium]|nr:hypothetical protein [Anaerolineales bacterium]